MTGKTELCGARIRPFPVGNDTELRCEKLVTDGSHTHEAFLRDYAYPGSKTLISWQEDDRRCFYGEWAPCGEGDCILPVLHRGNHAF